MSADELAAAVEAMDALPVPVPVGPEPVQLSEQQMDALVAAGNRVVNDETHEHLCMCDAWPQGCVSTGHYFMGAWDVDGLKAALPAVLGLWERMRGGELLALKARVAELEAERHSTNEALDDAVQALRLGRDLPETVPAVPAADQTHTRCSMPLTRRLECGHCPHEVCEDCDRCPCSCRCATGGPR